MTRRTCLTWRDAIDRIESLMTTRASYQPAPISGDAFGSFQPGDVNRVKLSTEFCLLIRIACRRAADLRNRFSHFRIDSFPFPRPIVRRITVRSTMSRADGVAVICVVVVVTVT